MRWRTRHPPSCCCRDIWGGGILLNLREIGATLARAWLAKHRRSLRAIKDRWRRRCFSPCSPIDATVVVVLVSSIVAVNANTLLVTERRRTTTTLEEQAASITARKNTILQLASELFPVISVPTILQRLSTRKTQTSQCQEFRQPEWTNRSSRASWRLPKEATNC